MVNVNCEYDVILDAREDRCPMPLLKAKMALSKMEPGQLLCIETCDGGALKDIPFYVDQVGHTLRHQNEKNGVYTFVIQKN